ncbi:hypothetical protein BC827DRAFT_1114862, partial [Russula dissimulans]
DVRRYLIKLLLMRGYVFNRTVDFETMREIEEKLCYASYDLNTDTPGRSDDNLFVSFLPNGRTIKVCSERFEASRCMFQPHLMDIEQPGVANMFFETIQSTAVDVCAELCKYILSGGLSMCP